MVVVLIQARYLDEQPLTNFLTAVFETQYTMIYTRGFFQCVLPRSLNKVQIFRDFRQPFDRDIERHVLSGFVVFPKMSFALQLTCSLNDQRERRILRETVQFEGYQEL
ncbi:hypothetical protein OOU_Y34scaffold00476g1 [Pyricularia oryzae Y34]|uniref:Uncharacterized protein n=1 Tax=Pyricularia oryzae (strain Y34) TaxID=1143189 RepID=A0AA97PM65_PYRO3|nr:hypothetical protein OOU_Y34scaffold00476g1 [Pyricularia oryzae Y34]